jgi:hypothetical protein
MKRPRNAFPRIVQSCLALSAGAFGQEVTEEVDPFEDSISPVAVSMVRVQVEFVEMPHATLTHLLSESLENANDVEIHKTVTELVEKREAHMMETMLCVCRSGDAAGVNAAREYIYPTEPEPSDGLSLTPTDLSASIPGIENDYFLTPTVFETRNLGSMLEVSVILSRDRRLIDLNLVSEIVEHAGHTTWFEWLDERGDASVRMPDFYVLRIQSEVTLQAGQPLLVGAFSPKDAEGNPDLNRKVIAFVRADVLTSDREVRH